jgi:trans-2,3-dihydro-3-hydroxyanthranilate isomerase
MHFSETTFICSDQQTDGGFVVRIFTPGKEVPFAGHPTLGTAYVISEILGKATSGDIRLNLGVGQIPVARQKDRLWMTTNSPSFDKTYAIEDLATVLNLKRKDFDQRFPIQVISTGIPFIVVPLQSLEAVKRCRVNADALAALKSDCQEMLVFTAETYSPDCELNVRVFCPRLGVPEDPATGSANSCLAGYLVKHQYFGTSEINLSVEQGMEIHRPSRLYLKAQQDGERIRVQVGGKVQLIAKGELL